jgi:ppGpp synthetase/RelA/SpoT-type nucleotidyltranferase
MDIIEDFMARYVREYDFYDKASGIVARTLEQDLQEAGVRCIITNRAKTPVRLEAKCRQRNAKNAYSSLDQVYEDIVDLAGVRVALYFPLQRTLVGNRIESLFHVLRVKIFPEESREQSGDPRFVGYSATHYHVRLREDDSADSDKRFATAKIEIQIASVLMHAWAEVNHDLVYKPQQTLSIEEDAILNQLNGLVTTGEAMLESLQRLGEQRIAERQRRFSNHYDLAAYLLSQPNIASDAPVSESGLGRVDLLFDFLAELDMVTPEQLEPYLEALHGNLESRPLAQQVVDALTAEDSSRYATYQNILRRFSSEQDRQRFNALVGRFLESWVKLEQLERELVPATPTRKPILPTGRALEQAGYLDGDMRRELDFLRKMRNQLVHGIETPSAAELDEAADLLDSIVANIRRRQP